MKLKRIFGIGLILCSFSTFSQSLFDKYSEKEDVEMIEVSKKMFEMFSKIEATDAETQEFMQIAKKLTGLKVFTTQNKKITEQMKADVNSYQKSASLQELVQVKNKSDNVKFFVKERKSTNHFSELLMFVNSNSSQESVLLTLTGDISLKDLSVLAQKMRLPKEVTEIE